MRESHGCCSKLSPPPASALVADLSSSQAQTVIVGDVGLLSVLRDRGSFPAPKEGRISLHSFYTKADNLGFWLRWDLVRRVEHGVA